MERGFYPILFGTGIALFFYLLCFSEDYWVDGSKPVDSKSDIYVSHYGLWRMCYHNDECYDIDNKFNKDLPRWMRGVQTCAALSVLILTVGFVMVVVRIISYSPRLIYSAVTLLIGPLCMLIALSVYTDYEGPELPSPYKWGWGFIISWIITCIAPIVGCYACILVKDE